jgi:transposase
VSANDRVVIETGRRRRRRHSDLFKSDAVEACQQTGVSVSAVALSRGLNANLLRRWLVEAERSKAPIAIQRTAPTPVPEPTDGFVPVMLTSKPVDSPIRIEVRRKGGRVSIEWPASAAHECALLLRELMK